MKRIALAAIALILFCATFGLYGQEEIVHPDLIIMDVVSGTLTFAEAKLLTEVFRTEIFKLDIFNIKAIPVEMGADETAEEAIERIAIDYGADRVLLSSVDTVFDSVVLNLRIIDVETNLIDFTDNLFIDDRSKLFEAVSELITKISLFYIVAETSEGGGLSDSAIGERWRLVGAAEDEINILLKLENGLSEFFSLRQYDINFGTADYIQVKKANWEIESIRRFLQSGIGYRIVEEAFRLGIVSLDNYRTSFEPEGISFDEYLEAYKLEIITADEYLRYREGYKRVRFGLGLGFVADNIPVATADFSAPILHLSIEYFISQYQRETWKYGLETGFEMFYGIVPTYYLQGNAYVGQYPLMAKLAVGGMAEVFVGGTLAVYARVGAEFFERFEFLVTAVIYGNENSRQYSLENWGDPVIDGEGINYPFVAVEFVYKF